MNNNDVYKKELTSWIIKFCLIFVAICVVLFSCLHVLIISSKNENESPIKAVYADCVSCETGTVFAKNIDVKEHIYYGEEYEFNILDAEVKNGQLILYRAHGEPVIFSLESGGSK